MNKEKKITPKLITIQLIKINILCKYEPIFTNQLSVTNQTNSHYEYKVPEVGLEPTQPTG